MSVALRPNPFSRLVPSVWVCATTLGVLAGVICLAFPGIDLNVSRAFYVGATRWFFRPVARLGTAAAKCLRRGILSLSRGRISWTAVNEGSDANLDAFHWRAVAVPGGLPGHWPRYRRQHRIEGSLGPRAAQAGRRIRGHEDVHAGPDSDRSMLQQLFVRERRGGIDLHALLRRRSAHTAMVGGAAGGRHPMRLGGRPRANIAGRTFPERRGLCRHLHGGDRPHRASGRVRANAGRGGGKGPRSQSCASPAENPDHPSSRLRSCRGETTVFSRRPRRASDRTGRSDGSPRAHRGSPRRRPSH